MSLTQALEKRLFFTVRDARMRGWFTSDRLWMLAAALAGSAVVIAAGLLTIPGIPEIEGDGIEYLEIGRNLLVGRGLVDDAGRVNVHRPPGYAVLAAAAARMAGDPERGGRLASLACAALVPWGVWLLGRELFGFRVGAWAAVLAGAFPGLVGQGVLVDSFSAYTLGLVLGAWLFARAALRGSVASAAWAGVVWGLAALARKEGIMLLGLGVLVLGAMALTRRLPARGTAVAALALLAGGAIAQAPYRAWLDLRAGSAFTDRKGVLFLMSGEGVDPAAQMRWGRLAYEAARYGLSPDETRIGHEAAGPEGRSAAAYVRAHPGRILLRSLNNGFSLYWKQIPAAVPALMLLLVGAGLLACLADAGGRLRLGLGLFPWLSALAYVPGIVEPRYLVPLVPLLMPIVVRGIMALEVALGTPWAARAGAAALLLTFAPLTFQPLLAARWLPHRQTPPSMAKAAGLWLKQHAGPGAVVMDRRPVSAFYAGAKFVPLPFAEPDAVLRFARRQGVTHLVLEESVIRDVRPQLAGWLEGKARTPLAPVYRVGPPGAGALVCRLR